MKTFLIIIASIVFFWIFLAIGGFINYIIDGPESDNDYPYN
jgi:hypothetical protein